ncbi:MAG: chloride channel protein [Treponema sp.]|jgi:H+/Cl- antiporter ClcA|nr:chloride channel protein [Treponema sp.]
MFSGISRIGRIKEGRIDPLLRGWYASRLALILESILIGLMVGLVAVLFRRLLTRAETLRLGLYRALSGLICAFLGDLFKRSLYLSLDLYDRLHIPLLVRPVIPLLVSVPLAFLFYDVTGGGHDLIESLSRQERSLALLFVLLGLKILFTALCYGSGSSGGIFLPLLAAGGLTGMALGKALGMAGLATESQGLNFMILGMAAFFTGAVKAPVTGIVLILEMSGTFSHLENLALVCFSSFVVSELIASRPVYAVLLERLEKARGKSRQGPSGSPPGAPAGSSSLG